MAALDVIEAIHTARSLRRLKPDPVPETLITQILDAAIRAPSAGNAQNWLFMVVRDADQRARLGDIYRRASDIASAIYAARERPSHLTEAQWQQMLRSGGYLWEHIGEAPVLLLPCLRERGLPPREALPAEIQARYDAELAYMDRIRGASIYPAVQNIILACRSLGLATLITTNHLRLEDEVKAVLGLPAEIATYALMPIGYPIGSFGPVVRRPVTDVACADRWGIAWPG